MVEPQTADLRVTQKYIEKYAAQKESFLYPTEYLVRLFLGHHELSRLLRADVPRMRLLDYSAGDGRNSSFFLEQGYQVLATEISSTICEILNKKFCDKKNWQGSFQATGCDFGRGFGKIDIIVACHSIYYMNKGDKFPNYLKLVRDNLNPGGYFIASFVTPDNYYFSSRASRNGDYLDVDSDPLGIRNGQTMFVPETKERLIQVIQEQFGVVLVNRVSAEYPNVTENLYWVVAQSRG